MKLNFKIFTNKLDFILVLGFIFLPIILHLNEVNFRQYQLSNIAHLVITQLLLSLIVFILSLTINYTFFKKNFLSEILICNFAIFYFLFYYIQILNLKTLRVFNSFFYLLDNFITLVLYIITYVTIFYCLNKFKRETKNFFLYFIIINFIFAVYNMNALNNIQIHNDQYYISSSKIDLNKINPPKNNKKTNVYLIILDGMINLEKAKNEKIINSKKEIIQKLKNNNYSYNGLFNANYHWTYVSFVSLLYGDFPVTDDSKRYKNRDNFFSYNMLNKKNFFYQIIDKLDMNFFWIGNEYEACNGPKNGECFYNYNDKNTFIPKLIFSADPFYKNSIFSYLFYYFLNNIKQDLFIPAYDFLKEYDIYDQKPSLKNKANFFLIHVLKPHDPYDLDQNCKKIDKKIDNFDEREYYKYNYNCVLDVALNWDTKFLNKDDDNIVVFLGDHGWRFENQINDIDNVKARMNDVFFAYKTPKKCNSIAAPNSHVNVMRFILKCLNASNPRYLEDTQYIIRHESHEDYGKTKLLKQ
mgnify:FL=1